MFSNDTNRAIFYQFITVFLLVTMNFAAKYVSDQHHSVEVLFFRNAFSFISIFLYIMMTKKYELFKTNKPMLHVKRSISGNLGVFCVFTAFSMLPMADMTAILSATPLTATIFAFLLLGEKTRPLSWIFILFGVVGVFIVAQPSGEVSVEGIGMALIAVCTISWVVVQLREMGRTENTLTTVFYFYLVGTVVTTPFMFFMGKVPTWEASFFLLLCAVSALVSQVLKTEAIKFIPVSIATPLSHIGLIWAAIYGYVFWDDIPENNVIVGAVIIMVSSFCLVKYKERKVSNV